MKELEQLCQIPGCYRSAYIVIADKEKKIIYCVCEKHFNEEMANASLEWAEEWEKSQSSKP